MKNVLDTLYERGFIKQSVYENELRQLLEKEKIFFYVGFDPTADSLHIGHYIPIMAMMHMQRAGHKPIALFGGGTAMIGDPSGKTDMRNMLSKQEISHNINQFKKHFDRFFPPSTLTVLDNGEWLNQLNYIDFLRDIGIYFSVNKMLTAECYKARMEKGLNFLEFNYMLMQAYDFLVLYKKFGCKLQIGGNDQWSNILAGADLIRRKEQEDAFALTFTLLETSTGQKMGKTAKGALWLDSKKTSPYEFYQYFRNVEDIKVAECFKLLTFLPLEEIAQLTKHKDERINEAKKRLAYEVTKLIHGEDEAKKAEEESKGAFGGGSVMPTKEINADKDTLIIDVLILSDICKTKSEARRLIEGGAVSIYEKRVTSFEQKICDFTPNNELVLHKGKKVHLLITF